MKKYSHAYVTLVGTEKVNVQQRFNSQLKYIRACAILYLGCVDDMPGRRYPVRIFLFTIAVIGVALILLVWFGNHVQAIPQFYYRNVFANYERSLVQSVDRIEEYLASRTDLVTRFAQNSVFSDTGNNAYGAADLIVIQDAISRLSLSFPEGEYIQIFDNDFSRLLFTNNQDDITEQSSQRIELKSIDQILDAYNYLIKVQNIDIQMRTHAGVLFNADQNNIIYYVSTVSDSSRGGVTIIVHSSLMEIDHILTEFQLRNSQEQSVVFDQGLLLNGLRTVVYDKAYISNFEHNSKIVFDHEFEFINMKVSGRFGDYNYLTKTNNFVVPQSISAVFYTVLLITVILFILLSSRMRHDSNTIIRERIRKFRNRLIYFIRRNNIADRANITQFIHKEKQKIYQKVIKGLRQDASVTDYFEKNWRALLIALNSAGIIETTPISGNERSLLENKNSANVHVHRQLERDNVAPELLVDSDDPPDIKPTRGIKEKLTVEQSPETLNIASTKRATEDIDPGNIGGHITQENRADINIKPESELEKINKDNNKIAHADLQKDIEEDVGGPDITATDISQQPHIDTGSSAIKNTTPPMPKRLISQHTHKEKSGLLAWARLLKHQTTIIQRNGIYSVNDVTAVSKNADEELSYLVESIS